MFEEIDRMLFDAPLATTSPPTTINQQTSATAEVSVPGPLNYDDNGKKGEASGRAGSLEHLRKGIFTSRQPMGQMKQLRRARILGQQGRQLKTSLN
ncbi:unnamed protein product [Protopolystoma xenopodis]|uniref:Uncharacterized protein n=1 Tax=Protopolystoma xenopodis TaxID=117903 RepID=A0A448WY36_9PLAT|nr:unnamed protein product [Protopolystoma xenopodis]